MSAELPSALLSIYYLDLFVLPVSGNVPTCIVKVLAAVCALDHFAKARPFFAVQKFDFFSQVRVFAVLEGGDQ